MVATQQIGKQFQRYTQADWALVTARDNRSLIATEMQQWGCHITIPPTQVIDDGDNIYCIRFGIPALLTGAIQSNEDRHPWTIVEEGRSFVKVHVPSDWLDKQRAAPPTRLGNYPANAAPLDSDADLQNKGFQPLAQPLATVPDESPVGTPYLVSAPHQPGNPDDAILPSPTGRGAGGEGEAIKLPTPFPPTYRVESKVRPMIEIYTISQFIEDVSEWELLDAEVARLINEESWQIINITVNTVQRQIEEDGYTDTETGHYRHITFQRPLPGAESMQDDYPVGEQRAAPTDPDDLEESPAVAPPDQPTETAPEPREMEQPIPCSGCGEINDCRCAELDDSGHIINVAPEQLDDEASHEPESESPRPSGEGAGGEGLPVSLVIDLTKVSWDIPWTEADLRALFPANLRAATYIDLLVKHNGIPASATLSQAHNKVADFLRHKLIKGANPYVIVLGTELLPGDIVSWSSLAQGSAIPAQKAHFRIDSIGERNDRGLAVCQVTPLLNGEGVKQIEVWRVESPAGRYFVIGGPNFEAAQPQAATA